MKEKCVSTNETIQLINPLGWLVASANETPIWFHCFRQKSKQKYQNFTRSKGQCLVIPLYNDAHTLRNSCMKQNTNEKSKSEKKKNHFNKIYILKFRHKMFYGHLKKN